MAEEAALLPGTLDLLILKAVSLAPEHGYGVLLRIEQITGGALLVEQGALYPALARLEHQGLLDGRVGHFRQQSSREVLSAHRGRPAPAQDRQRAMGPPGAGHVPSAARARGVTVSWARWRSLAAAVFRRRRVEDDSPTRSGSTSRRARAISWRAG